MAFKRFADAKLTIEQLKAAKNGSTLALMQVVGQFTVLAQDFESYLWTEAAKKAGNDIVNLLPGLRMIKGGVDRVMGMLERGQSIWDNATETGATEDEAALQVFAVLFFDATGAMGVYRAASGTDPVTLETFDTQQRFMMGLGGIVQLGQVAVASADVLHALKGPCGGYLVDRCFVGETLVLTGEGSPWEFAANVGVPLKEAGNKSFAGLCWILGIGSAVLAFASGRISDERRKKRGRLKLIPGVDALFIEDPANRFLDEQVFPDAEDAGIDGAANVPRHSVARRHDAEHCSNTELVDIGSPVANAIEPADNSTSNPASERTLSCPNRSSGFVTRGLGIMAAVLLAFGSLMSIRDAGGPPNVISVASAEVQRSNTDPVQYSSKPIRNIQPIADRVLADNPETPGQAPSDFGEFVAADWRILRFLIPKPDREWMLVTLARPQAWIEAAKRDSTGRFWLEFKELGIASWANVLAIEPCPEPATGQGRLVTGKFEHSSAEVIDLHVNGLDEPISTTSNHPFWSENRQDFIRAGSLRIGERLKLRDGSTPVVTAAAARSQSVPVFNLEVDGEHVDYVSASGVLVHNTCDDEETGQMD